MDHHIDINGVEIAKRLQALAQAGLEYSENKYDIDRYREIRQISLKMLHDLTKVPMKQLVDVFTAERGYPTPKVDVRGVVFRDDRILMVKETIDDHWSVPGGWADVGFTPFEVAKKEVFEESGLDVRPLRLLAVFDKRRHNHPVDLFDIYKMFILCEETGGQLQKGMETSEVGFFSLDALPPLSTPRITEEEIRLMFEFRNNPGKETVCD